MERFWSKVDVCGPDECWPWLAALDRGYGQFWMGGRRQRAHRIAWQILRGVIPVGLVPDHTCRNRACQNPQHMELVTGEENVRRGESPSARQARQTHCVHGHEFTAENTYVEARGDREARKCRTCRRDRQRARLMSPTR